MDCCPGYKRGPKRSCKPKCDQFCENSMCTAPNECTCNAGFRKFSPYRYNNLPCIQPHFLIKKNYLAAPHIVKIAKRVAAWGQIFANATVATIKTKLINVSPPARIPAKMASARSRMFVHAIKDTNWTKRIRINVVLNVRVSAFKENAPPRMYVIVIQVCLV